MENHIFSDPVPFPEGPFQPCWKVEVYRRGVDEPVGSLEIHAQNLPPRKAQKKNKTLWKLPDTLDDTPRFGGLEKERLWELFKREKKTRRKSKKKGGGEDALEEGVIITDNHNTNHGIVIATNNSTENPIVENNIGGKNGQDLGGSHERETEISGGVPLPPPPGFGVDGLSLQESSPRSAMAEQDQDVAARNKSLNTPPAADVGPSSNTTTQGGTQQEQQSRCPTPPPPPPPGLQQQQQQDFVASPPPGLALPSTTEASGSAFPPAVMATALTPPSPLSLPQSSFVFGSLRSADIAALRPEVLSTVIGSHVAQVLIQSLTTPGQLPLWLSRYHPQAQKVLLIGTAQALAQTPADRQRQWESLIVPSVIGAEGVPTPAANSWDCQGWAVQTLTGLGGNTSHNNNGGNGESQHSNHVDDLSIALLVVLTGRTLQRQEILTYHLTLTLYPVLNDPLPQQQQQQPEEEHHVTAGTTGGAHFRIHNEILSLSRAG